jgi:hypothetical protein
VNINRETGTTMDKIVYRKGKRVPALGVILRQEELSFIKEIPTFQLSPTLLK